MWLIKNIGTETYMRPLFAGSVLIWKYSRLKHLLKRKGEDQGLSPGLTEVEKKNNLSFTVVVGEALIYKHRSRRTLTFSSSLKSLVLTEMALNSLLLPPQSFPLTFLEVWSHTLFFYPPLSYSTENLFIIKVQLTSFVSSFWFLSAPAIHPGVI